ncbi:MAG: transcriptional regulator, partial [Hydrogenoanaerobacterium sp.]
PKNQESLFTIPNRMADKYASAMMQMCSANAQNVACGTPFESQEPVHNVEDILLTTQSITEKYPQCASSLLNLIQTSENKIAFDKK